MYWITTFLRNLELAQPKMLWLLLLVPFLIVWYIWRRKKLNTSFVVSSVVPFESKQGLRSRLVHLPFIFKMLALVCIIVALSQPQSPVSHKQVDVEGVDIVLTLDVSGSMLAMDFRPNRLEACKSVMKDFAESRTSDRLALVLYSGEAYTKCPLTSDHHAFLTALSTSENGQVDDGTAIGDGLGTAVNRLRESKAKSKVIILLSDGVNNCGYLDPLSAAELAKEFKIKVYTIGCGTVGEALVPTPFGNIPMLVEIDEPLLKNIAQLTGGHYFRAQNKEALQKIYQEIDQMEKSKIMETRFSNKNDEFFPFLVMALLFFCLDFLLRYTYLKIN